MLSARHIPRTAVRSLRDWFAAFVLFGIAFTATLAGFDAVPASAAPVTRSISGTISLSSEGRSQLTQRVWISVTTLNEVEVARVRVSSDGTFHVVGLLPNRYRISFVMPTLSVTSVLEDGDARRDGTTVLDLRQRSEDSLDVDFEVRPIDTVTGIGGSVWIDVDGDGEPGIDDRPGTGVWVIVEEGDGKEVGRAKTDAAGRFQVNGLCVCRTTDPQLWLRAISPGTSAVGRVSVPVGSMSMTARVPLTPVEEPTTTTTPIVEASPIVQQLVVASESIVSVVEPIETTTTVAAAQDEQETATTRKPSASTTTSSSTSAPVKNELPTEWMLGSPVPKVATTTQADATSTTSIYLGDAVRSLAVPPSSLTGTDDNKRGIAAELLVIVALGGLCGLMLVVSGSRLNGSEDDESSDVLPFN